MRKLIEVKQVNLIECDNPACNYHIKSKTGDPNEDIRIYLNMPCPKCGENLLTEEDYEGANRMMSCINWINKWFSWITIFYLKKSKSKSMSVHYHNGVRIVDKE